MTDTDVSDPIAGLDCQEVELGDVNVSASRWNVFNGILRLMLDLP